MLKIWGRKTSSNVQKVMWLLGELDVEYEHVQAGGAFGRVSEAQFAALNPNRLVPVVEDEHGAIWESHAILRYLAARHGGAGWWSDDPFEREADAFAAALKKNKKAQVVWEGFSPSHRREYIEWIAEAKTDVTRDKRIATTLEWLIEGKSRNWKYEKK